MCSVAPWHMLMCSVCVIDTVEENKSFIIAHYAMTYTEVKKSLRFKVREKNRVMGVQKFDQNAPHV